MNRQQVQWGVRLVITVGVLVLVGFHVGRLEELAQAFQRIRWYYVGGVIGLMLFNLGLQYKKWLYILRVPMPGFPRFQAFLSLLSGFTLGFTTPGRLGELGRGLFLSNVDKFQITGLALLDKTMNNIVVFIFGCLGLLYLFKYPFNFSIYILLPLMLLMFIIGLFLGYLIGFPERWLPGYLRWIEHKQFLKKYRNLFICIKDFSRLHLITIFGYSLIFYAIIFLQFYLLTRSFAAYPFVPAVAAIAGAMFSKTLLPISLGDLGVRESAAVYFLYQIGVAKAHAFEASILLFVINILIPSLAGVVFIPRLTLWNQNKMDGNHV